jgi:ribulose-phosphate 3-epimerase
MSRVVRIAPSVLACDLSRLADEVAQAEAAGADYIHIDVMDGCFVPNITVGPPVIKAMRASTKLPFDVHLMVCEPERYLEAFASAGADLISVQVEATRHLQRTLSTIRALGKRAGVVLNPSTSEHAIEYVLGDVDLVLAMTVNPGFGGQSFLPSMLPKIRALRAMIERSGLPIELEVDGGIAPDTIPLVVEAGADVLVTGVAFFGERDRPKAMRALRRAAEGRSCEEA